MRDQRWTKWVSLFGTDARFWRGACLVWLLAHVIVAWQYAANFPYADDLGILDSVSLMLHPPEGWSSLRAFLMPHNVHLPYFNQLVYLTLYGLFQQVHFSLMIGIGHVIAALIAWQLSVGIQGHWRLNAVAFACLAVVLNLLLWDNLFWAFTALQNYAVVLFALVALRRYAYRSSPGRIDMLWLILPGLVQANGLLVPLIVVLHRCVTRGRVMMGQRDRWLLFGTLSIVVLAAIHVLAFGWAGDDTVAYSAPVGTDLFGWQALLNLVYLGICTVGLLGSLWFEEGQGFWTIPVGLGLLVSARVLLVGQGDMTIRFVRLTVIFMVLSVAVIALGRGIFMPFPELVTTARYKLYSLVLLGLVTSLAIVRPHFLLLIWLPVLLLIAVLGWQQLPLVQQRAADLQHGYYHWLVDGGLRKARFRYATPSPGFYIERAYEQGIYSPFAAQPRDRKVVVSVSRGPCPETSMDQGSLVIAGKPAGKAWQLHVDGWQANRTVHVRICRENGDGYLLVLPAQRPAAEGDGRFLLLKSALDIAVLDQPSVRLYARFADSEQWYRLQYSGIGIGQ